MVSNKAYAALEEENNRLIDERGELLRKVEKLEAKKKIGDEIISWIEEACSYDPVPDKVYNLITDYLCKE